MNWKIKVQNPAFWITLVVGIAVIIGTYFGVTGPDLTTWPKVTATLGAAIANPYVVVLIVVYILNALFDLSTPGFKDSAVTLAKISIGQTAQDIVNLQLKEASEKSEEQIQIVEAPLESEKEV